MYSLIALGTTYAEILGISLIANLRYLLMSASISQKFAEDTSLWKRIMVALCITDEVFGISIAYPGKLAPSYTFSAAFISTLFWASGTACGILAGGALPTNIVAALSVALYGMFIAIVIPPSKKDHNVGRAAEQLVLGDISTGASNDISRATQLARKMVGTYGMSDRMGSVAFDAGHDEVFIGRSMAQTRPYSEETAAEMDREIRRILDEAYGRCTEILEKYRPQLTEVAEFLLQHETMTAQEFEQIFASEDKK